MPTNAHSGIPNLPRELASEIVKRLSCKDICNATLASKAFWQQFGNAIVFLEGATRVPSQQSLPALLRFQRRRIPLGLQVSSRPCTRPLADTVLPLKTMWLSLQVEALHFYFHPKQPGLDNVALDKRVRRKLQLNLQLCSATLTELYLDSLYLVPWMDELKVRWRVGSACNNAALCLLSFTCCLPGHNKRGLFVDLQVAICQCKQLVSLHISFQGDKPADREPDASSLVMEMAAALPNLATLQWRDAGLRRRKARPAHLFRYHCHPS